MVKWAGQVPTGTIRQITRAHDGAHARGLALCEESPTRVADLGVGHTPAQDAEGSGGAVGGCCAAARNDTHWARGAPISHGSLQDRREGTGRDHRAIQGRTAVHCGQLPTQRCQATLTNRVELTAHCRRAQALVSVQRAELALAVDQGGWQTLVGAHRAKLALAIDQGRWQTAVWR